MRFIILTILICLTVSFSANAQRKIKKAVRDTLSTDQIEQLAKNDPPNTFTSYQWVLRLSKENKTDSAEMYLQYVNPYQLMREGYDMANLDAFLFSLAVSDSMKKAYRKQFKEAYNSRNETYLMFQQMYEEDQEVRKMQEMAGDTYTYKKLSKKMRETDSLHFETLYNYTQEHGWPSIEDGGLYAEIIAIHDHARHGKYLGMIKERLLAGQAYIQTYSLIKYWLGSPSQDELRNWLDTVPKATYKADFFLKGIYAPHNISEMMAFAEEHCPVKYVVTIEVNNGDIAEEVSAKFKLSGQEGKRILTLFNEMMLPACKEAFGGCGAYCWSIHFFYTDSLEPKVTLHIVPKQMKKG